MKNNIPYDNYDFDKEKPIEIYDERDLYNSDEDFPEWFKDSGKNFGRKVSVPYSEGIYTLKGMAYTSNDYYYILESLDGKDKIRQSCCLGLNFL